MLRDSREAGSQKTVCLLRLLGYVAASNSHVRMDGNRRALDEIDACQRAADERRREEAEQQQPAAVSKSPLIQ